ncbi:amidase family protein [Candidatus Uabimicrobium amorphum]|uniref:Amidase n=1 Tax=Uabimicrobium amorphum TaxID=2596890 RepID=A0A5S9F3M1_UABAM|nr:amidase family protein [Candidatus Uabimicrobium amorphum]BBM84638.1 amidase [Candidatus Uabimicrobium amorphum]
MKIVYILVVILCMVLVFLSIQAFADTSVDRYINKQIKRQTYGTSYPRIRVLDFSPFVEALKKFSKDDSHIEKVVVAAENIYEIQKLFDEKKLSSQQLVLFYLKQIQTHDPQLNAVLELNPEVLEEAILCDKERSTDRSPIHGIPVLLKDNIAVAGKMYNTAGAAALKDAHSDRDAELVKHLRENGAIILGKTNLSEWANFMTFSSANGFSTLGGQTQNPYGRFDVGGSSSGSASAVAKNLCCVAVGTETSGSIIYPASQNSVFALKPTLGVVSQDRIIPITSKQDTAGPMAQNATDLSVLFQAMQKKAMDKIGLDKDALAGKKIGVLYGKQYEKSFRSGDMAFREKMQKTLGEAGAKIVEVELKAPQLSAVDAYSVMVYDFPKELGHYLQQTKYKITTLEEIIRFNYQQPRKYAPFGQGILRTSVKSKMTKEQQDVLVEENRKITRQVIDDLLEKNDVDVLATLSNYFTLVYAPCGYPAISIPLGYRDSGEPIGMTLVARKNQDAMLLQIAYAYEQKYKPRKKP